MFAARRNLHRHCFKTLSFLLQSNSHKDAVIPYAVWSNVMQPSTSCDGSYVLSPLLDGPFNGWYRAMSTSKGRSMRSKVERRMQKESGKTAREIRRAKKIKKKLMTDEERLIYNLKRAKKKVAVLLQKLKKYELPELPPPLHDPELLTAEQLQAYKKIGFRNKNYVPVGVRGVFGGVVQNMHLHWKFHETVQVCCDNFPKERIKDMATMLARLSGGIVVNVHNVKTIIMFRGRNYRQPKNLIPINTLTKRKALFKARFEQALESQKLNIKKIEQELRRKGINPEDPAAMASVQRVASTFFNAIDEKEGSPYVFHGFKKPDTMASGNMSLSEPPDDSDQEDLDKFIAEIEDAADREWAEEEAAEEREHGIIRYRNKEEFEGRPRGRNSYYDGEVREPRGWKDRFGKRSSGSDDERGSDSGNVGSDYDSDEDRDDGRRSRVEKRKPDRGGRSNVNPGFRRNAEPTFKPKMTKVDSESEDALSDLDNAMWQSESEEEPGLMPSKTVPRHDTRSPSHVVEHEYESSSDDEFQTLDRNGRGKSNDTNSGNAVWESESDEESIAERYDFEGNDHLKKGDTSEASHRRTKTPKEVDELWDSD